MKPSRCVLPWITARSSASRRQPTSISSARWTSAAPAIRYATLEAVFTGWLTSPSRIRSQSAAARSGTRRRMTVVIGRRARDVESADELEGLVEENLGIRL